jgi:hypothetical protein
MSTLHRVPERRGCELAVGGTPAQSNCRGLITGPDLLERQGQDRFAGGAKGISLYDKIPVELLKYYARTGNPAEGAVRFQPFGGGLLSTGWLHLP